MSKHMQVCSASRLQGTDQLSPKEQAPAQGMLGALRARADNDCHIETCRRYAASLQPHTRQCSTFRLAESARCKGHAQRVPDTKMRCLTCPCNDVR